MTAWKAYIQFAALRSRTFIAQREPLQPESCCEDTIPTELDTRPHLVFHASSGSVRYWLDEKTNWRIGRSSECEIAIADQWMSRCHAAVQFIPPNEFYLVDLQSYNGSFINERRIRDIAKLENGDRIRLGKTELEFFGTASPQSIAPKQVMSSAEEVTLALQSSTPMAQ